MFLTWSIADVWGGVVGAGDWFFHLPVLGFLCVLAVTLFAVAAALEFHVWWEANKFRY
jgi:hypothetical protein